MWIVGTEIGADGSAPVRGAISRNGDRPLPPGNRAGRFEIFQNGDCPRTGLVDTSPATAAGEIAQQYQQARRI